MTFTNSNYRVVQEQGGSSITAAGTNGNQTAPPLFRGGIGDFHGALGSPTIDGGATASDIGALKKR